VTWSVWMLFPVRPEEVGLASPGLTQADAEKFAAPCCSWRAMPDKEENRHG